MKINGCLFNQAGFFDEFPIFERGFHHSTYDASTITVYRPMYIFDSVDKDDWIYSTGVVFPGGRDDMF